MPLSLERKTLAVGCGSGSFSLSPHINLLFVFRRSRGKGGTCRLRKLIRSVRASTSFFCANRQWRPRHPFCFGTSKRRRISQFPFGGNGDFDSDHPFSFGTSKRRRICSNFSQMPKPTLADRANVQGSLEIKTLEVGGCPNHCVLS